LPTLQTLRHALSRRFNGFESYTAGVQLVEDGSYTGTANGVSATRRLVSTDLADMNLAGTASDTSATQFDGAYVYIPDTREHRRIVKSGYVPNVAANTVTTSSSTSIVGYYVLHRPLQRAVPGGTVWEVHRWPVRDDDRKMGLHSAINRALSIQYVRDRISLTGVGTTVNRYSLAAYPWITAEDQLVGTLAEETVSGLDPYPLAGQAMIRLDGDTPYLITGSGVPTGDTFTIDVMRPRSSWIKRGDTWSESTVGLEQDSDEATGAPERIAAVAEYLICRSMENSDPTGPGGQWAQRAARLAVAVGPWLRQEFVLVGQRASGRTPVLANVPGGLREVAPGGSSDWP
jgi:hypothetical protein